MTNNEIRAQIKNREELQAALQTNMEEKLNKLLMDISQRIGGLVMIRNARFSSSSLYMEVGLADPDNIGQVIFGAGAEINVTKSFNDKHHKVELNVGSCGSFDAADYGQVKKCLMVGELVKEMANMTEMFVVITEQNVQLYKEAEELHSQLTE